VTAQGEHTPAAQVRPVAQRWSQAPQLFASVAVFTQAFPQRLVVVPAQVVVQAPALQNCPAGQGWLQAPQFALSVLTLVHRPPPQGLTLTLLPQLAVQTPATQLSPGLQTLPQAPQLVGEV